MVGEDRVAMSAKELRRGHVIRHVIDEPLTQVEAGTLLGLTDRQIRRLIERVKQEGDAGLAHRGRGKPSNSRGGEGEGAEAVRAAVGRLWADVGGGEVGRAPRDHAERGDAAEVAPREGRDALSATGAPASNVAGAEGACGGTGTARRLAP